MGCSDGYDREANVIQQTCGLGPCDLGRSLREVGGGGVQRHQRIELGLPHATPSHLRSLHPFGVFEQQVLGQRRCGVDGAFEFDEMVVVATPCSIAWNRR